MKDFPADFKPLPIGVDDFKKMITQEYYYADKTLLIKELLDLKGEVNLFTRPRRFGKTLNLSMLKYFFEDTMDQKRNEENKQLFHGLHIAETGKKYTNHMCGYPVIHLTLKSAKQRNFEMAYNSITEAIAAEFKRHGYLLDSGKISEDDKNRLIRTKNETGTKKDYYSSLKFLSDCLYAHTGKKSIVLIDEYDVPLEAAHAGGFYSEMIDFIRSLFESVLKNNLSLDFAVVTGYLRISRESIFTGLNNLRTISILDKEYSENFGFLEVEVKNMLAYYELETHYADIKDWYDGYCFGDSDIYNPWSVINFVRSLISSPDARPKPFWANTSSNSIVKDVLVRTDKKSREQIETLIRGGSILIRIKEETTYEDVEKSSRKTENKSNNFWNFLFFTGYLTKVREFQKDDLEPDEAARMGITSRNAMYLEVRIPNREVESIYENTFLEWFEEVTIDSRQELYTAALHRDIKK